MHRLIIIKRMEYTNLLRLIWFIICMIFAHTLGIRPVISDTLTSSADIIARRSTVRIFATTDSKKKRSRVASGFYWKDSNTIVTSYHVVVGAKNIGVEHVCDGFSEFRAASLEGYNKKADLAVLHIADRTSCSSPINLENDPPKSGSTLWIVGFPIDATQVRSIEVKLSDIAPSNLRGVMNSAQQDRLSQLGFPSLDIPVLHLERGPLPGNSGSMLITQTGSLVGIADGGLLGGTVGIGWAIPAQELQDIKPILNTEYANDIDKVDELLTKFMSSQIYKPIYKSRSATYLEIRSAMTNYNVEDQIMVRSLILLRTEISKNNRNYNTILRKGPADLVHELFKKHPISVTVEGYLLSSRLGGSVTGLEFQPFPEKTLIGDSKIAASAIPSGLGEHERMSLSFLIQALEYRNTDKLLADMTNEEGAWVELRSEFDISAASTDLSVINSRLKAGYGYFWLPAPRKNNIPGVTSWPHICMLFTPEPVRREFNGKNIVFVLRWNMKEWRGIVDYGCAKQMSDIFE